MFLQLEHNTPEVYSEKSRDFQLFCRIFNIYLNALIEQSNKIIYNTDVDSLNENLLYLKARRLGFTTHKYFPPNILRNICETFPSLIRRKGTEQAIKDAVYTILSVNNLVTLLGIDRLNPDDKNEISIISNVEDAEIDYISELLSFIVPAGVKWNYVANVTKEETRKLPIEFVDTIVRFRGIGNTIARIMSTPFPGANNNNYTPARGIDWDYLYDNGYNRDWGEEKENFKKPGGDDAKTQPFYSKINVVKIVRNMTTDGGIAIECIRNEINNKDNTITVDKDATPLKITNGGN